MICASRKILVSFYVFFFFYKLRVYVLAFIAHLQLDFEFDLNTKIKSGEQIRAQITPLIF
jgi:hypothetical protein